MDSVKEMGASRRYEFSFSESQKNSICPLVKLPHVTKNPRMSVLLLVMVYHPAVSCGAFFGDPVPSPCRVAQGVLKLV